MNPIIQNSIVFLLSITLLMTYLLYFRLRQPTSFALWLVKVFVSALSPLLFLFALLTALLGFAVHSVLLIVLGFLNALLYGIHIGKITRPPKRATSFGQAFGPGWESSIPPEHKTSFLPKRYVFKLPKSPDHIFDQNISFYTIPDTDRRLLCDIWQPPKKVQHSGLAFIYLHDSAWTIWDKDRGTRTFFRHLAKQGHVIMDVAYRLFPETDFMGMVHDAKHAIAWMRANAEVYSVNPNRIVIGGGSAGGHIALLAAYTHENWKFMPNDLEGFDTSVQGVVSWYGPSDLEATYYHAGQHLIKPRTINDAKKDESASMPKWLQKSMGENYHRLGFDKKEEPGILCPYLEETPLKDRKPIPCFRLSPTFTRAVRLLYF
ncbi:alpha/beta hydrolase [Maribacter halichondriae]|uniref:alpha/beta hydrolase n=1 Tax=Maribacter halichondriae TaxID=2980554 RepID=UPI0023581DFC|nr:alpha/beta hydrolase [Maribacter sp. Hal144]